MIRKPKGTYDLFGEEARIQEFLSDGYKIIMDSYNYDYIRTPVFESTELFSRGVGETTDVVSKEMYTFTDKGNRSLTLRPEGTAGVIRSYIENKMHGSEILPIKLWYQAPMYRYERPQAGRYREFSQFGVEAIGIDNPIIDVEIIKIAYDFFNLVGINTFKILINTLGDNESRSNYREALLSYFKDHLEELCPDCNERYVLNPLRILDCKVDREKEIFKNVPVMAEYLSEESILYFNVVKKNLDNLGVEYTVDNSLVRGLDYYTDTVFEFVYEGAGVGSQNTILGGGKYNGLIEELGGTNEVGIGFGIGIERLVNILKEQGIELNKELDIYIFNNDYLYDEKKLFYADTLREFGFAVDVDYFSRNIKNNYKQAERLNSRFVLVISEDEIVLKNLVSKEENVINDLEELLGILNKEECLEGCECHESL